MSNKQLPPELVDRMIKTIYIKIGGSEFLPELSKQCAQIAVDYADEQNAYIQHTYNESLELLQKQRDELIECLTKCEKSLSFIGSDTTEIKQLLKKNEDGKE